MCVCVRGIYINICTASQVMDDQHCAELMKPPWRISCAWSSWDFGKAPNSGSGCKNKFELRRLWYSRHHYMSRVIGARPELYR